MSREESLEAIVEESGSAGELLVRSPAVGIYSDSPEIGDVLVGHGRAGRLSSLGCRVELVLPRGTSGRVAERPLRHLKDPVEFGQVLFRLVPVETKEPVEAAPTEAAAGTADLPAGCFAVSSPTHGMFYRKPRPDAPPYVEVGRIVDAGATMGLVEVMKCFSAITYGGEGLPSRAELVEVRAEDASEVQADQILFVVKAAP